MSSIFTKNLLPNKHNLFIWINLLLLILLLILGKTNSLTIVIAYFLETIIVGIVNVFKMFKTIAHEKQQFSRKSSSDNYAKILFFIVHYGFFIAVQLIFVFSFLGMKDSNIKSFKILNNLEYVMTFKGMTFVLASILVYNLADYFINFISPKVYETADVEKLFIQPYVRIFIQQFAVIIGGFFIILIPGMLPVAILLIVFRTLIELILTSTSDIEAILLKIKNKKSKY